MPTRRHKTFTEENEPTQLPVFTSTFDRNAALGTYGTLGQLCAVIASNGETGELYISSGEAWEEIGSFEPPP